MQTRRTTNTTATTIFTSFTATFAIAPITTTIRSSCKVKNIEMKISRRL